MSAPALLAELHAAGITVTADGDDLRIEAPPSCDLGRYLDRILADKPVLLAILRPDPKPRQWAHVFRGEVDASTPPAGWDGNVCDGCQWPDFCAVLGPRGPELPGGPCAAHPVIATAIQETAANIAALPDDDWHGLMAEIAAAAPGDPNAAHDRAAFALATDRRLKEATA